MDKTSKKIVGKHITAEEVKRLLDAGRLLFSVLTHEEIKELQELLNSKKQIGNTGDS